ncbi:hypothetical protein GW17_00018962 [Ensete ventricosum]|nr:hypothetical protein GW17_00018962 [Ensete ventricosum]
MRRGWDNCEAKQRIVTSLVIFRCNVELCVVAMESARLVFARVRKFICVSLQEDGAQRKSAVCAPKLDSGR